MISVPTSKPLTPNQSGLNAPAAGTNLKGFGAFNKGLDSQRSSQTSRQLIRIELSTDSPHEVNYLLNSFNYSMRPGEKQQFREDRKWVIRFDRGRGFGQATYTLSPGQYRFVRDEASGWQLYRVASELASVGR